METMKSMNNGNSSSTEALAGQAAIQANANVHSAVDKAADHTQQAVDRVAASAHTAIDKISVAAAGMSDKLAVKSKQLKETQERLMVKGREQVKANPAVSVAIALAAGVVIGRLLGWRK